MEKNVYNCPTVFNKLNQIPENGNPLNLINQYNSEFLNSKLSGPF